MNPTIFMVSLSFLLYFFLIFIYLSSPPNNSLFLSLILKMVKHLNLLEATTLDLSYISSLINPSNSKSSSNIILNLTVSAWSATNDNKNVPSMSHPVSHQVKIHTFYLEFAYTSG